MHAFRVLAAILPPSVVGSCRNRQETVFKLTVVDNSRFVVEISTLSVIVPDSRDINSILRPHGYRDSNSAIRHIALATTLPKG